MTLEVVRALRLHERRRDGIDDYVRVFGAGDAGQLTAVLASASESGWDMCWPVGQELFLAAFAVAQHAGLELAVCFEHAAMSFVEQAAGLVVGFDPDVGEPVAQAAAVAISGSSARLAWLGKHAIMHVRGDRILARNAAHTLGNQQPELRSTRYANVVTRVIRPGEVQPDTMSLALLPGDRLLLLDGLAREQLADAELCRELPPSELAQSLMDLAHPRGSGAYAACCVIRVGEEE